MKNYGVPAVQQLLKVALDRIARNKRGATMVEYAIMLVSIAAVSIILVGMIGTETSELFQSVRL